MGINLSLWMPEQSFYQTNLQSVWIGMLGRVSPRVSIWIRSCSICSCICCIICCIASCFHSSISRKSSPISLFVTTSNIFKKNHTYPPNLRKQWKHKHATSRNFRTDDSHWTSGTAFESATWACCPKPANPRNPWLNAVESVAVPGLPNLFVLFISFGIQAWLRVVQGSSPKSMQKTRPMCWNYDGFSFGLILMRKHVLCKPVDN